MALVIMGLGNPGKEYAKTRHNAGRLAVELVARQAGFDAFIFNKTANALVTKGELEGENAVLVLPETMMNLSGKSAMQFIKSPNILGLAVLLSRSKKRGDCFLFFSENSNNPL